MSPQRSGRLGQRLEGALYYLLLVTVVGLLGWLSQRYETQFDWSHQSRNTLSVASQQLLTRLESPLEIRSFAPPNPELRARIKALIEPYQQIRSDISLVFIDPASQPQLTREAGIRLSGELQFSYQGRSENLGILNEQTISNTIQRLIQQGERWIVTIVGHGERTITGKANHDLGQFGSTLLQKGYRLQSLNLTRQPAIPRNTSLLVLASPQLDYLPGELKLIDDYLNQGGNLLWLTDPGEPYNLSGLFEQRGLGLLPGTVVDANAAQLGLDNPAIAVVNRFPDHPATNHFNRVTLFPFATALKQTDSGDWQATPLLQTQAGSWNETGPMKGEIARSEALGELAGPLTIGMALSRSHNNQTQRLLVIGDGDFISNSYLGNGGNMDLGLNLIRWLTEDDNLLDIPAKTASDIELQLSPTIGAAIGLGFLFILPMLLICTGLLIWWRRRSA
ncbi:MAG: GldG family protein [Sedimenticola sp.]|nr:GldG family protein [Sedimenticola sp.]